MQVPQPILDKIQRHEQYLQADPNNLQLQFSLGDLYSQAGRLDDALACFDRCLAQDPNNIQARSRSALVLIAQHRFADAERVLRGLLSGQPNDTALQHNLGITLYYQHRFDEAAKSFAQAADGGLKLPINFAYLAKSYHQCSEMDKAIEAGKAWVEAASDVESKSYLALLYFDDAQLQAAEGLAHDVLRQDPTDEHANVVVGSLAMEQQEPEQARKCLKLALAKDRENGRAWLGMGLVHLYEQQFDEAIAALENAAHIFPTNSGILGTLGWTQIISRDATAAETTFRHALSVDRTFAESHAGLAAALALQGQSSAAKESLALARRLDRHSIGADIAESFLLAGQGQGQAAGTLFVDMLNKSPREGVQPLMDSLRLYIRKKGALAPATNSSSRKH